MSDKPKAYVAGIGMITSIGADTAMTAASVKSGISGYKTSGYFNTQQQPMTMANVPAEVFTSIDVDIDEGASYSVQYDHIIKMAILALREAILNKGVEQPIPLVLAMPEEWEQQEYISKDLLITNLLNQEDFPLKREWIRYVPAGRAAGIQGIELAMQHLYQQGSDFVLLGGSDSYMNVSRLHSLDENERVLATNRMDGFAPGEGASFLLLSRHPEQAIVHEGHIVAVSEPGVSQEPGHYYNDEPYRGDGLDLAFKQALADYDGDGINTIYSSMNGESYWTKEYGVASMRNKSSLSDLVKTEHPADCYGDLGVASGPVLLGLAITDLLQQTSLAGHLVYSSSDGASRAAVIVENVTVGSS